MWRFSNVPTEMLAGALGQYAPRPGQDPGTLPDGPSGPGLGFGGPGALGGSGSGGPPIGGSTGWRGGGPGPNGPGSNGPQYWSPHGALQRLLASISVGPVGGLAHAVHRGRLGLVSENVAPGSTPYATPSYNAQFGNRFATLTANPEWLTTLNNLGATLAGAKGRADRQLARQNYQTAIRANLR